MSTNHIHKSRFSRALSFTLFGALASLFLASVAPAFTVQVHLEPIDSTVTVNGTPLVKPQIKSGVLRLNLDNKKQPNQVRFERAGYEAQTIALSLADAKKPVSVVLAELRPVEVEITTVPAGASIYHLLEGKPLLLGRSPAKVSLIFRKPSSKQPWTPHNFRIELADHQTETATLSKPGQAFAPLPLARLHEISTAVISARDEAGSPVTVRVLRDGAVVGDGTSIPVPVAFQRTSKDNPWNSHTFLVEDPWGVYATSEATFTYDQRGSPVRLTLRPVKEALLVRKHFPRIDLVDSRPALRFDSAATIAMIDTEEPSPVVGSVERLSNFGGKDVAATTTADQLNAYCVTPDGRGIILAVTRQTPQGPISTLLTKRAEKDAREPVALFERTTSIDTAPSIAPDGEDLLVFQSNRADRSKPDLFSVRLRRGPEGWTTNGGVARITTDGWFNFAPGFGSFTSQEITYLSTDPLAPEAVPLVKSVQYDGRLATEFPFQAVSVTQPDRTRVLLTARHPEKGRLAIYSAQLATGIATALISDPSFADADCFAPIASPDNARARILFVSNRDTSPVGRPQNDIYVMNADGTNIRRLTVNESDDLHPSWSPHPDEPDVVYFMSNRGGAYNVWRMHIKSSQ